VVYRHEIQIHLVDHHAAILNLAGVRWLVFNMASDRSRARRQFLWRADTNVARELTMREGDRLTLQQTEKNWAPLIFKVRMHGQDRTRQPTPAPRLSLMHLDIVEFECGVA
jgi:hypothetical protein